MQLDIEIYGFETITFTVPVDHAVMNAICFSAEPIGDVTVYDSENMEAGNFISLSISDDSKKNDADDMAAGNDISLSISDDSKKNTVVLQYESGLCLWGDVRDDKKVVEYRVATGFFHPSGEWRKGAPAMDIHGNMHEWSVYGGEHARLSNANAQFELCFYDADMMPETDPTVTFGDIVKRMAAEAQ